MALVLLRSPLKFNKVCNLYGTSRNICGLRLSSMGDKSNCVPQLLTTTKIHCPLALFKRHQLVRIRTKDYPSNKKYKNHWILEQCANISLIFLIPAAFLTENKHVDMAMGSAVILHSYWLDLQRVNKHVDDSWKQIAKDDCYVAKYYRWPVYTVQEAIKCHRETHHPTMYNVPNAPLLVDIELNMIAEKSTRFLDNFQRMAMVPHKFDHGENRTILVFTKNNDEVAAAREAGATLVGGTELIKEITDGKILPSDFQFIIAHTNILAELVALRGLMKRKFPNPKAETLGTNLLEMIKRFANGISYAATKDEHQQDYGLISTCIGPLDMDSAQLEENLSFLLKDINTIRPKREGRFITRVLLKSPPSGEQLKIDPFVYVPELYDTSINKKSEEKEQGNDIDENANREAAFN